MSARKFLLPACRPVSPFGRSPAILCAAVVKMIAFRIGFTSAAKPMASVNALLLECAERGAIAEEGGGLFAQLPLFDLGRELATAFEFRDVGAQRRLEVGEFARRRINLIIGGIFQII